MFKKFSLITSIALGLIISGCASLSEVHPFFSSKYDCGNGIRVISKRLCMFEQRGY